MTDLEHLHAMQAAWQQFTVVVDQAHKAGLGVIWSVNMQGLPPIITQSVAWQLVRTVEPPQQ